MVNSHPSLTAPTQIECRRNRRFARMTTTDPTTNLHRGSGIWSLVHAERAALAADLAGLTDQQWMTLSLCTEFTVRQVLAHLTAGASLNPVRWLAGVIRCRFDFDKTGRHATGRATRCHPNRDARAVLLHGHQHHQTPAANRGDARRIDRARRGHPPAAGHTPRLPDHYTHPAG